MYVIHRNKGYSVVPVTQNLLWISNNRSFNIKLTPKTNLGQAVNVTTSTEEITYSQIF